MPKSQEINAALAAEGWLSWNIGFHQGLFGDSGFVAASAMTALAWAYSVSAQSGPRMSHRDVLQQLLPDGAIPKDIRVEPGQRNRTVQELKSAQRAAHYGQQPQQAAFLLAALNADYEQNRDYLLHVLSGCNYPVIRYGCDDMTGFYLIYLWEHGHKEILAPLIKGSIDSYDASGSEGMGGYFGDLAQKSPQEFLAAVGTFPIATQKKACSFAGTADGGGLGSAGLAQARKNFRRIGSPVALRCLKQIENANKPE